MLLKHQEKNFKKTITFQKDLIIAQKLSKTKMTIQKQITRMKERCHRLDKREGYVKQSEK